MFWIQISSSVGVLYFKHYVMYKKCPAVMKPDVIKHIFQYDAQMAVELDSRIKASSKVLS